MCHWSQGLQEAIHAQKYNYAREANMKNKNNNFSNFGKTKVGNHCPTN